MSAYILDKESFETLLAALLKQEWSAWRTMYNGKKYKDKTPLDIVKALHQMNVYAVEQRYRCVNLGERVVVFTQVDVDYLLSAESKFHPFGSIPSNEEVFSVLRSLRYQCSEADTEEVYAETWGFMQDWLREVATEVASAGMEAQGKRAWA